MINYAEILSQKYNGSEWTINGDDYEGLTWLSDTSKPTKKQLDDLWPEIQNKLNNAQADKAAQKAALLARLGLTEDELKTILG
jgi:hypothetical protein